MNLDLLRRLCETPGIPGHEHRVRDLIRGEVESLADGLDTNPLGTLIARRGGAGADALRVMLLCHMDEIGFMVSHVTERGFLHLQPVGGFDPRNLFARRVRVCTDTGDLPGVMSATGVPIHISSPDDRRKVPEAHEFYVDLGLGEAARDKVKIGDMVVLDEPFLDLGPTIVSKALDNRVACWLGIETLRALSETGTRAEVHVAFTVQEEVGLRGARTAAYQVRPDIGIGIDTTLAVDTPGVPEQDRTSLPGAGVGLHVRDRDFIADIGLVRDLERVAAAHGIPHQRTILRSGGQDGAAAQQAAAGARAAAVVVPTRYIHTVCEMVRKDDLQATLDLLVAYLRDLGDAGDRTA